MCKDKHSLSFRTSIYNKNVMKYFTYPQCNNEFVRATKKDYKLYPNNNLIKSKYISLGNDIHIVPVNKQLLQTQKHRFVFLCGNSNIFYNFSSNDVTFCCVLFASSNAENNVMNVMLFGLNISAIAFPESDIVFPVVIVSSKTRTSLPLIASA